MNINLDMSPNPNPNLLPPPAETMDLQSASSSPLRRTRFNLIPRISSTGLFFLFLSLSLSLSLFLLGWAQMSIVEEEEGPGGVALE